MTDQPERLDLRSHDVAEDKRQELLRLFPEVRTEGGTIDFDRLRLALGDELDAGKERYGLTWPGKADCFKTIQAPSLGTLRPCLEEAVNFDTTENLIIEGDNLEVLKLLQKSYLGKVRMIYIDPPYNTGNDFIYPDNYTESLQTYLAYTGQADAEGRKFGTNTETDGRFHSKWLNMMYPRLYLGRNLLREDGFFLASIDDVEVANLTRLLDEIFGEENRVACLVYDKNRKNDAKFFSVGHEYIVVYARNKAFLRETKTALRAPKEGVDEVRQCFVELRATLGDDWAQIRAGLKQLFDSWPAGDPRKPLGRFTKVDEQGPYREDGDLSWPGGGGPRYEVPHPQTRKPCKIPASGWRFPRVETMMQKIAAGAVVFGPDETTVPGLRRNLFDKTDEVMRSVHYSYAQTATQRLQALFDGERVFDNPKNEADIRTLVEYLTDSTDIVLDFFAGSGTTAHAVTELNNRNGESRRRFILVQLPEPTGRHDYPTIADICKERVRRVITRMKEEDIAKLDLSAGEKQDRGFRVFKLAESNFKPWDAGAPKDATELEKQLVLHVNHIREGRTPADLLYEILLKSWQRPALTEPVQSLTVTGKTVHSIGNGLFFICLEQTLTLELIRAMADKQPERIVCLDEGFAGNDQLKANASQIFKTKGITSFKTV